MLDLVGIDVAGSAPNRTLVPVAGQTPLVVLHLPLQHVTEAAFDEQRPPHEAVFVESRAAAPSRLAFRVDPAALPIAFRLEDVLELLARSALEVTASAARGQRPSGCLDVFALFRYLFFPPRLSEPTATETAIELPFRLVLSPESQAGFEHRATPVRGAASTRAELWHSVLRPAPDRAGRKEVRAIWLRQGNGPPWNPNDPKWQGPDDGKREPFEINTMSQRNRADIVHVSGNRSYGVQTGTAFEPQPVAVRRLALSALGAWLDSRGDWSPPQDQTALVEWTHRATQGRDQFVRIVEQGFLYPFGHLAAKITVSERKFVEVEPPPGDPPLLLQREYIVVREPVKTFVPGAAPSGRAHTMPLHEVRLRTLVTPPLKDTAGDAFLIVAARDGKPVLFDLTGTDVEGHTVDLTTHLVWIDALKARDPATVGHAQTAYGAPALPANGATVALAPGPKGDTAYAARSLAFTARPPAAPAPGQAREPGFWPELDAAEVAAPALQIIAGAEKTVRIAYHEAYRANGLGGANLNEVIAELKNAGDLLVDFSTKGDRAGGLIQPSMAVVALSRQLGPVGGDLAKVGDLATGTFDPSAFFKAVPAMPKLPKLVGVFELQQVLGIITGAQPSDLPRMVTERAGNELVARQVWHPVPVSYPKTDPIFVVDAATKMEVAATFDARSATPTADVRATLTHFRVHLLGNPTFLKIGFERVEFAARTGSKPDVDVKMGEVVFAGPLLFVERLRRLIPLDGFSDPPALDITPAGVRSSFSLAVPDLAVGVFALQNLSLGAGFAIPFVDGALTVNFAFCARAEPFLLTVSLFGGGGFFGLAIDPNGVQQLEASLEFGASCAINLGVAQGGVHVMAGIYFKLETAKGCTLTGYLRIGGNMSVLGLISVSIELNLSFTYKEPGKAYGRAVVTVEIDVFLFSTSVELECERQFAGGDSDPSFAELMPPSAWHEYCGAYA